VSRFASKKKSRVVTSKAQKSEKWYNKLKKTKKWYEYLTEEPQEKWYEKRAKALAESSSFYTQA
jgi:hypothetical protein